MRKLWLIILLSLAVAAQGQVAFTFTDVAFVGSTNVPAGGGGGDGPNVWYDVETSANGDSDAISSANSITWADVTVGASGTATKLRLYLGSFSFGASTLKMALYDSGGNILSSGSVATSGTSAYVEVTLAVSQSVTATGYKIAWENADGNCAWRYKAGTGTYHVAVLAYASFPPATLPTPADFSGNFCVSVYVD